MMPRGGQKAGEVRRTLLGARIIFNNRSSIFDCVVHERSGNGAVLRMANTLGVPHAFQLHVKPSDERFDCEIAWRTEVKIGVTFRHMPEAPAALLFNGPRDLR
jgi:hypothetical protein